MSKTVKDMLAEANAAVATISPDEAKGLLGDPNTVVVDVRDAPEVAASGKVRGAINISRGMIEFRADPASPYHDERLSPEKTVIVYCASGGRSALVGQTLQELGYRDVRHLGGFKGWVESGGEIDPPA
jgi:rhodanese-related sulfurtransferase